MNVLHEMSIDDMNASYASTYALINNRCVHLSDFFCDEDYNEPYVFYKHLDESDSQSTHINDITLCQTDLGMFEDEDGSVLYIARKAERQWKRGLRTHNLLAYSFKEGGEVTIADIGVRRGARVAKFFLEKQGYSTKNITRDMCVTKGYLFFRNLPIGKVIKDGVIQLHTKQFIPRIGDWVYENNS